MDMLPLPKPLGANLPTRGALPPMQLVAVAGEVRRALRVEAPRVNGAAVKPANQADGEVLLLLRLVGVVRHSEQMVGIRSGYQNLDIKQMAKSTVCITYNSFIS
jgi:hypothetical protein